MKAVKINMSEAGTSRSVKALIAGVLVNISVTMLVTIILALFLNIAGNLFENILGYAMLLPLALGGYFGGLTSARINGANGLFYGVISGTAVLIIMIIIGFSVFGTGITYMLLLKVIAVLIPAAVGGIKGVNKKEKFKI